MSTHRPALLAAALAGAALFFGNAAAALADDLYAVAGTTTIAGQTMNVWGYNTTGAAATKPGGPTIFANQGATVSITLHNTLPEASSLLFNGQALVPDRTGAAPNGGTTTYSFVADKPGTYLYEAGLTPNGQHQVAMGLYGALVVRPTAGANRAYSDASTTFDDEGVLLLSEIDPALNANPAAFDMRKFNPRYFLINGNAYPDTAAIETIAGHNVLLRYVNAGIQYHSMALLGQRQRVVALDGDPLAYARTYVADTIGPGQTEDAIVSVPGTTHDGARLTIYDGSLAMRNSNTSGVGGMLTFIHVANAGGGGDTLGPATTSVAFAAGTLTANVTDAATGGSTIAAAEYYVDSTAGAATALAATDGAFDEVSEGVTASSITIPPGPHTLYVRGRDVAGNWGSFSSVLVGGGDQTGPVTKSASLTPSTADGTVDVAVHATGDDTTTGNSTIAAAQYWIDSGAASPLSVNNPATVASLDGTIPKASVLALTDGTHTVSIRAQDSAGNWGDPATVNLVVNKAGPGPVTSSISTKPSPNNGTMSFLNSGDQQIVRVQATETDTGSTVTAAELFIDTVKANGTGIGMAALDGTFNSATETVYADIPLATVRQLTPGSHTISIHGKNVAGKWGVIASGTLVYDPTPPTVSGAAVTPSPSLAVASVTLTATATESITSVTNAEYWIGSTDPGTGNATAMTITGSGPYTLTATIPVQDRNEGSYTVHVRARDAATNWSPAIAATMIVTRPIFFSTVGNTNPSGVAGTADDSDIYNWSGSVFSRSIDVSAAPYSLPTSANVDGYDRVDATHFYLSFNAAVTLPVLGTVQDEDVVYWNGSAWTMFFDGSVQNVGNTDLDAISIAGGQLYFSTDNTAIPNGAGGTGDDADVYRWNGGTSFTRVIDASVRGWSTANVDGLVYVDVNHVYLSYADNTAVPTLGGQQDEDIVFFDGGTWSVYFDGTGHGLGSSANLDLDAFDLP